MRQINFLLAAGFVFVAFMKVDGAYPILWIIWYGTLGVVHLLAAFEVYNRRAIMVLAIMTGCFLFWAFANFYFPGAPGHRESPGSPSSLSLGWSMIDFIANLVGLLALIFNYFLSLRKSRSGKSN